MKRARRVLLLLSALWLCLMPSVLAQEEDVAQLYLVAADYYLQFNSINTLLENVASKLSKEHIQVIRSNDSFDSPRPYIIVVETDLEGKMISVATSEEPLFTKSPILESNYGYAFSIDTLDSENAADVLVGFSLYALGKCEQAIGYLGNSQKYVSSKFDLDAVMAFYAGNCSLIQGDLNLALVYLQNSMQWSSYDNFATANNLAWTYLQLSEPQKAFELFDVMMIDANNQTDPSFLTTLLARRIQLYGVLFNIILNRTTLQ